MDELHADLRAPGCISGAEDRAEALAEGDEARVAEIDTGIDPAAPRPRVFVHDSGEDQPFTAGRHAMPTALIKAADGTDVMDNFEKGWARLGWEEVVGKNPEVVVIVNHGEVTARLKRAFMTSNPAFAGIDAVRDDRFVAIDSVAATPGPRNVEAIATLGDASGFD